MTLSINAAHYPTRPQTPAEKAEFAARNLFKLWYEKSLIDYLKALFGKNRPEIEQIDLTNQHLQPKENIGLTVVPLSKICGSVSGRAKDFDSSFRPLNRQTEGRWVNIAKARRLGKRLPPVQLLQIGNKYFIEDGHHRISVCAAFGDQLIDATVMVCG